MHRGSRRRLAGALLGAALLTACGGAAADGQAPADGGAVSGTTTVFAAASLTDTFTALAEQFEAAHPGADVVLSFGGSSTLAQQILSGAPADVFASASSQDMDTVVAAGDAADPQLFATNVAQVAVAPDSAARVQSLDDLARPDVKVALCSPEVPCGALAEQVLARAGLDVDPVTLGLDVRSVLAHVLSGEVDAGLVYATDVAARNGEVVGVEVPAEVNASTSYPIAVVQGSDDTALAQAFVEHVLSADGQAALAEAGFAPP